MPLHRLNPREDASRSLTQTRCSFKKQRKGLHEAGCRHLRGESMFRSDSFGPKILHFRKSKVSFDSVSLRHSSTEKTGSRRAVPLHLAALATAEMAGVNASY